MTEDGSPQVIIPFQPDGGQRDRVLGYVVKRWVQAGYDPSVGQSNPDEPWCKSRAVGTMFDATDAEILILVDADVWCDENAILNAVTQVDTGGYDWAIPHGSVYRLDETSTNAIINGGPLLGTTERVPYLGIEGGGLVVIRRTLYEQAPIDPRFIGWGHEDQAAGVAWRTLAGAPWRGEAKLWHLWHAPAPRLQAGTGSRESRLLLMRYLECQNRPDAMRSLIAEARQKASADGM